MQAQAAFDKDYIQELFKEQLDGPRVTCTNLQRQLDESLVFRALLFASVTILVLLVFRPPFAMSFRYDKRRPWRADASLSWPSVLAFAAVSTSVACALPRFLGE